MDADFEDLDGTARDVLHVVVAHDPVGEPDVRQILEARRGEPPDREASRAALNGLERVGFVRVVDDDGVETTYGATPDGVAAVEARLQWLLDMY